MFNQARLRLTLWYLAIIMVISLFFSVGIYSRINSEFNRFERAQSRIQEDIQEGRLRNLSPIQLEGFEPRMGEGARINLVVSLALLNFAIFILAGGTSYILSGITLKPIKDSLDEQNRFITDSSHELRTPLTSLRSEIEVALRNKNLTLAESKKLLASNLEETINLQQLSDHLLELAQNGDAINPADMKNVSIAEIVKNAIKRVEPQAKIKQIEIKNRTTNLIINGISDRLTEVFVILLDNAIKYSPKNSSVTIRSQKERERVKITVVDQGVGIEKEDIPHIFDRFYRANKSRTKIQTPGYGLGLSIAKKIIESHGGTINIASKAKEGTTVVLELPA